MSKVRNRNTQIPLEAIKGAAGYDAKFRILGLSNEQILALGEAEEYYKTLVTNKHVRDVVSTDLIAGSIIKAYATVKTKEQSENKSQKDDGVR